MRASSVRLVAVFVLAIMLAGAMHWIGSGPDGDPHPTHHAFSQAHHRAT